MKTIQAKPLSPEAFGKFGSYARIVPPEGRPLGPAPSQFYPDLLRITSSGSLGVSVNRLQPRETVITALECHDHTQEVMMPVNGDVLMHFAPATRKSAPPLEEIEVFYVPQGTALAIHPGVWHHSPFPVGEGETEVLVLLPERTYENDCYVHRLAEDDRVQIDAREARP